MTLNRCLNKNYKFIIKPIDKNFNQLSIVAVIYLCQTIRLVKIGLLTPRQALADVSSAAGGVSIALI